MRNPSQRARGLTLIEVLAALAIVAIILPVIMEGVSLCLKLGGDARQRSEAATLARGKLEELMATGPLPTGQTTGDFGPQWPGYQWAATVQPWSAGGQTNTITTSGTGSSNTNNSGGNQNLNELDVQVTWTSRNRQRSIVVGTLVNPGNS